MCHTLLSYAHILKIFLVQCLHICVRCRCLSTVPTGCKHGFSVPMYLHNSNACQASEQMCLCTIKSIRTEACVRIFTVLTVNHAEVFPTMLLFSQFQQYTLPRGTFHLCRAPKKRLVHQRTQKTNSSEQQHIC